HLRSQGLGRGDLAGILLERDATFATALIAVLKTGAGHVLLDPDFPDERLHNAATEAAITHLVTRTPLADRLPGPWTTSVDGPDDVLDHSPDNPGLPIHGDDLACVMFTSGSTGRPKGILSSHRNLVSTLVGQTYLPTSPDEIFLQSSPISWDAFSLEFWGPLLHGARVVLQPGQKPEPALIAELAQQHKISTLLLSASLFNYLTDEHPETFTTVTTAYTVGEAASPAHVHKLHQSHPGIHVINGYGPAEAMIYATTHTIEPTTQPHTTIPIGTPLTNKPLYILDTALRLCAPGTTGELYVAGDGLAHGYLNRPELTATHFIPNPYGPPGTRLYRTGDLAHFDHHGNLHYQGRADNQIKIRGFRIEPAEIETALLTHPHITQATVTTHHKQLAAYIVTNTPTADLDDIRRHLTTRLPEHLIPTHLTTLDKLPLTPNGKIDKRALPEPTAVASGGRAPRNLLEETLTSLFASTLDTRTDPSIDDDFFQLGGHSILAARLTNRIAQALGVRLTIRDVFENPTVVRLAEKVGTEKGLPALPPLSATGGPDEGSAPMSFAQRRLWLLADLEGGSTAYNVPMAVRLEGPLNVDALDAALNDVVERHAPLRTLFETVDGEPRQRILPAAQARVAIQHREVTPDALDRAVAEAGRHVFDLRTELPLTVMLFRLDEATHHLVIVLHHIATDGESGNVYFTDLAHAYTARNAGVEGNKVLEPLQVRYADYAVWQQRALGSAEDTESILSQELAFWRETLDGLPEEHTLNLDRPRPAQATHRGGTIEVALEGDLFGHIGALARA
ncbi:amino acid adenylation domain-containing protein, partial [Streptomyces sp. NPDC001770]